jgi:hypothetical protein
MPPAIVEEPAAANYYANANGRSAVVVRIVSGRIGVRSSIPVRIITVVAVTVAIVGITEPETKRRITPTVTTITETATVTIASTEASTVPATKSAAVTTTVTAADAGASTEAPANTGTAAGKGMTAPSTAMSATPLCKAQRPKH